MIIIIADVIFWALCCSIASIFTVTHFTDKDTEAQGFGEGPSMTPGAEGGPDPTDGRYEWLSPGPGRAGNTRLPGAGTVTEDRKSVV